MTFEKRFESYSGKEYEYDLMDKLNTEDPAYIKEYRRLQKLVQEKGIKLRSEQSLPFRESLELAKKFQPSNPTNPRRPFAKELRLACAEKLGLETDEELEQIKIYTCVDGPADTLHDTDFFISVYENGEEWIIRGQISQDSEKPTGADMFVEGDVPDPSDLDFDKKILEVVEKYAIQFFEAYRRQKSERKNKQL